MTAFGHIWSKKLLTYNATSIEEFIQIYEAAAAKLRGWQEKGVELDPQSNIEGGRAVFTTPNFQLALDEAFEYVLEPHPFQTQVSQEGMLIRGISKRSRPPRFLGKFCLLSKRQIITQLLFNATQALATPRSDTYSPPVNIGIKWHGPIATNYVFQLYEYFSEDLLYLLDKGWEGVERAKGIVHFYHLRDTIDETLLHKVKVSMEAGTSLLFVGYDSLIPPNPEKRDPNRAIIDAVFPSFQSCYISAERPESMYLIFDILVCLRLKRLMERASGEVSEKNEEFESEIQKIEKKMGQYHPHGVRIV